MSKKDILIIKLLGLENLPHWFGFYKKTFITKTEQDRFGFTHTTKYRKIMLLKLAADRLGSEETMGR